MKQLYELLSTHREAAIWVSCVSACLFVGTLLLVPWLVARAPQDYFTREERARDGGPRGLLLALLRNVLGVALLLVGVLMLVLPGQGMLTVLIALCLLDLPGKRALERRVVRQAPVWRALSYLRERARRPPFDR